MTGVYNENGSLNLFGYDTSMDYNETLGTGLNEWYMKEGSLIMPPDSEERVQHYWDWEQHLMDNILPCQPSFAPKVYHAMWANLDGYDITKLIKQSWGAMSWDGTHDGQSDDTEIVTTDAAWSDLNPLFSDDASSSNIYGATLDPLIYYDPDLSVWPHLAKGWTMVNDTHCRITLQEGITWQTDPDGAFTDEPFDAEDVYFTFYAWATVSNDPQIFDWIDKMEIVDSDTIDFYIDGDSDTPDINEPYAPFLPGLATYILPEHYLNQTQLADGVTPDITHESWDKFATSCFGTSLFELGAYTEGVETELEVWDDCWWMDETITSDPALDWANRFGDKWELQTHRIRIIPDQQTALLEFEAGKVDLFGVTIFPEKRDEFEADPDFEVQSDTQFYFGFFGYNMRTDRDYIGDRTPCDGDPSITKGLAIRKAISYAIDRNEINNVIHRGEYTITDHPIYMKQGIWCNPNIIRYNHDLDKAREYMELAGFEIEPPSSPEEETKTTEVQPGFGFWLALGTLIAIGSASFYVKRKLK
ncbi:ABC transporter substrate-binding protein [Candidatus Heimdallarchaeota archaeon]|nr:MAG: ABC transporter substrate-binding protein [Candidatus Heimdallarchaeota archaeon]